VPELPAPIRYRSGRVVTSAGQPNVSQRRWCEPIASAWGRNNLSDTGSGERPAAGAAASSTTTAIRSNGQIGGSLIEHGSVNAYGSAILFVSNDHSGTLCIEDSIICDNTGGG
jgi:hypothetical protein